MILTKRGLRKRIADLEGHEERLKERNAEQRELIAKLEARVWQLETQREEHAKEQVRLHERIGEARRLEGDERRRFMQAVDLAQQILELERKEEPI